MRTRNDRCKARAQLVELGTASADTLGELKGDIPEPMGFWRAGISDR